MKRKTLISVVVMLIMLLNCISPLARVYAAETKSNTITLNSELYTAVSEYMKNNNIKGFTYNDLLRTITASGSSFSSVKELSLKEKGIEDLTGLEVFTGLETLDLSGNYLTLDSNLDIINGFSSLSSLDLSTNRIDGFSWLNVDGLDYKNLNRQYIDNVKIIEIPSEDSVKDKSDLPENNQLLDGMISELNLESIDVDIATYKTDGKMWDTTGGKIKKAFENRTEVGTDIVDYEEDKIKFNWNDIYTAKKAGMMYYVNAKVVNSKHKYYDSEINLYFIFVDETERGIVFKDENFYKCVKEQLTKNSQTNPDNLDVAPDDDKLDRNLYNAAYDKALTLVISIDDLRNHIKSLICQNEKIKDLTGLEKFIGLETELDVSFNYIDSIERIIELETNKGIEEEKIRKEISDLINQLTSAEVGFNGEKVNYRESIKNYLDKLEEYNTKKAAYDAAGEHTQDQTEEINNLKKEVDKLKNTADDDIKNINKILKKLEKAYDKSYNMATGQTAELYAMLKNVDETAPYKTVYSDLSKDELISVTINELQKLESFEKEKIISEEVAKAITQKLASVYEISFTPHTSEDGGATEGGPISQFNKNCGQAIKEEITKANLIKGLDEIKKMDSTGINSEDPLADSGMYSGYSDYNEVYEVTGRLIANNTDEMLKVVIELPRLKDLDISVNDIESLATIDTLTKLLSLNASDNLLTTIEDVNWSSIEWLESLNLGYNQLQTYEGLRGTLPNLKKLYLNNCLFSGVFDFDFISYFDKLNEISFAGNYYSDLTDFVNKYIGKLKRTDYSSLAEYIKEGKGINFSFANQTVRLNAGQVDVTNNSVVTIELPPIFRNIEEMDPYHTTYGVVPETGTVDEHGRSVIFTSYKKGTNEGIVTIQTVLSGVNNNETNTPSVGNGTTCYIEYQVGEGSSSGNTELNPDPSDGNNDDEKDDNEKEDNNKEDNNKEEENGSNELKADNIAVYKDGDDNFILVAQPNSTNSSLAKVLSNLGVEVKSIDGKENFENDNKKVYTSEVVVTMESGKEKVYDVVVLGDVDGNGKVDSIDSGYSRALKYGTLYADIKDENERVSLMDAFKETSNFKAADLNQDGSVRTYETAQLLYYRAGLIENFNAELSNIAE